MSTTTPPLNIDNIDPALHIEEHTNPDAPGAGTLHIDQFLSKEDRLLHIEEQLGKKDLPLHIRESLEAERDKLKDEDNDKSTTLDREKRPKKDIKRSKPEKILEKGDILDYMFDKWFLAGLDEVINFSLYIPEWCIHKLGDKIERALDKREDDKNVGVGNTPRARFGSKVARFKEEEEVNIIASTSAPAEELKSTLEKAKGGVYDDINLPADILDKLKASGENVSYKEVERAYRDNKARELVTMLDAGKYDEVEKTGLLSKAFINMYKTKTTGLSKEAKENGVSSILLQDTQLKIAKLNAGCANMLQKFEHGSNKFTNVDFNDKDLIKLMVDQEGRYFEEAMQKTLSKKIKKTSVFKKDDNSLAEAISELSEKSSKAFDQEKDRAATQKKKIFRRDYLNEFCESIKINNNPKRDAKIENQALIEKTVKNAAGVDEQVYVGVKKPGFWGRVGGASSSSSSNLSSRRRRAREVRQERVDQANELRKFNKDRGRG